MTRPSIAVTVAIMIVLLPAGTASAAPADTVAVAQAPARAPGILQPLVKLLRPTEWASLRLWPARHVESFASGTRHPAVASDGKQLLLVEVYQGGLYLSRLEPDSLKVLAKTKLSELQAPQAVKYMDAVVAKDTLWVSWIMQVPGGEGKQMFLRYNLQTGATAGPTEEHLAVSCSLATFSGQLWTMWCTPGPSGGLYLARYDTTSGLGRPQQWPIQRAEWVGGGAVDLGGELFVVGVKEPLTIKPPAPIKPPQLDVQRRPGFGPYRNVAKPGGGGTHQLWAARFDGQRFYSSRMLRGRGNFSHPACAVLDGQVTIAYASRPPAATAAAQQSSIDITVTTGEEGQVTSTSYDSGGHNVAPDAVRMGEALFVAYNKWSANPDSSAGAVNRGTYVGKIELKF